VTAGKGAAAEEIRSFVLKSGATVTVALLAGGYSAFTGTLPLLWYVPIATAGLIVLLALSTFYLHVR